MKKLKVMTVVGTRPEIIRLSRVISKLENYCHHILVHTGQNYDYELNEIFFKDLELEKPHYFLEAAGTNAAETIGKVIIETDRILAIEQPEALLILGDTNSCLASIPAKRRKIPIFHMEAGNRCFDQRVPEEINRKIVDHTADINLPYSTIAREYLLKEGIPADRVVKTGSPMNEVLKYYGPGIESSKIIQRLDLQAGNYFVFSSHREENVDCSENLEKIAAILNALAEGYEIPIVVSLHPRTRNRLQQVSLQFSPLVRFEKPFGFNDYINLQKHSKAVLSDSGTITEESSILNFPALNLREAHERPEGMEEASVMMTGLELERVLQSLDVLIHQFRECSTMFKRAEDYAANNVSDKVVRIIHSYTGYVNRTVWRR